MRRHRGEEEASWSGGDVIIAGKRIKERREMESDADSERSELDLYPLNQDRESVSRIRIWSRSLPSSPIFGR